MGVQTIPFEKWRTFTPTGAFTTNTTYTGKYRRIGKDIELFITVSFAGAPNTITNFIVDLPAGYALDDAVLGTITGRNPLSGWGFLDDSGAGGYNLALAASGTGFAVYRLDTTATSSAGDVVTQASPVTLANGDKIRIHVFIPVKRA